MSVMLGRGTSGLAEEVSIGAWCLSDTVCEDNSRNREGEEGGIMTPEFTDNFTTVYLGDCMDVLRGLGDQSVSCCVTSPPYWGLRDYGVDGQIGLENTPEAFVARLVEVFAEVRRVLADDGTCFVNLGDSYASESSANIGLKPKDLCGIPWRVAFALQADGWYLRQDIIWHKPNPMPESVTDRCTKAHEYVFLLSKSQRYFWDQEAMLEKSLNPGHFVKTNGNDGMCSGTDGHRTRDGLRRGVVVGDKRNRRSVWTINSQPYSEAHFATFPEAIPRLCIMAGCPKGGTVLDPFAGSGTTGKVATELGRKSVLIELNPEYARMIIKRTDTTPALL